VTPLLSLRGFGVAFGDRVVLADVSLDLPRVGLTSLVGPGGAGKSTLLRTLAGLNDAHPALSSWGLATFAGEPLAVPRGHGQGEIRRGIGFVTQHARFFLDSVRENLVSALPNRAALDPATQTRIVRLLLESNGLRALIPWLDEDVASLPSTAQRQLAIVRALVSDPLLLLADEPIAGLDDDGAVDVLTLLRAQASQRAILFVTHNQRFARAAGGTTILLSAGRVMEIAPARLFFSSPSTPSGERFVRTGGCADPSPGAKPEELDEETPRPRPLPVAAAARRGLDRPRGFFWLWPGRLGGLPRPGITADVEEDLEGLVRLGVTTLVTLEEALTVPSASLGRLHIDSVHFPIVDMGVPGLPDAEALCSRIAQLIRGGETVAMHCRAGLGRTGTMLACQLIFDGESARGAIDRVRHLNPMCIQSRVQVEFLSAFESFLKQHETQLNQQVRGEV
jgi:atypical dual specificity phosphatase